jgi:RNA polymerase sigma-70 factor, ECF subfamily
MERVHKPAIRYVYRQTPEDREYIGMSSDRSFDDAAKLPGPDSRTAPIDPTTGRRQARKSADAPAAGFAQRVAREIPFLRQTARRWHRQQPDADDLVQDTLVRALANARLWQPGSNLRAWLFTIMRNQFFAAIAKSSRSAALLQVCDSDGATVDAREARLVLRDVAVVLGRLPPKQRTALRLAGVEGKSYEEVAAAMGLSIGAVRCHLARGRDRLRVAVRGRDDGSHAPLAHPPRRRYPTRVPGRVAETRESRTKPVSL